MTRVTRGAYWLAPMVFCVALYWMGLKAWFSEDDFAWLNLRNHAIDFHSASCGPCSLLWRRAPSGR